MPKNIDFSAFHICAIIAASKENNEKPNDKKIKDFSECRKYDIIQSSRGKQQTKVTKRISMLYLVKIYSHKYRGIV